MQILESSAAGLRSSRMTFRGPGSPVTVTLYPMVHIGEAGFFEEAYREAFGHDVALIEGVGSPVTRHLGRSFRWLNFRKLGLAQQPVSPPHDAAARIVKADLTPDEFHREWRKIPRSIRAGFYILAPLVGLYRRWFCTHADLAANLTLDDGPGEETPPAEGGGAEAAIHCLVAARDRRLVECLAAELDAADGGEKRIALVYGAGHMKAVLRALGRRGFECSDAQWRTIFRV